MPELRVPLDLSSLGPLPGARAVAAIGVGLLCPGDAPGAVPGFRARDHIDDRKKIKLMTRSVQLGVSAAALAVAEAADAVQATPPPRRGIYVGASPQLGDETDLEAALRAASAGGDFDLGRFATEGIPLIHPLWLVRGLSNNVLGFASAIHDLQGVNASYCDGALGGFGAVAEGARAIAEGRADLVIAGGADALTGAEPILGHAGGEAAAFIVLVALQADGPALALPTLAQAEEETAAMGDLGAATYPVALARMLRRAAG